MFLILKSAVMLAAYAAPFVGNLKDAIAEKLHLENGQDLLEYAALAGFIGIAAAAAFFFFPLDDAMDTFAQAIGDCVSFNEECGDVFGGGGGEEE